jgi:hypothetical protein
MSPDFYAYYIIIAGFETKVKYLVAGFCCGGLLLY